jgi:glycosyltransferase involved in cell wall biosynthesis
MTECAAPAVLSPTLASSSVKPTLIVLSHLRWDFVTQRPQHLLTRAANDFRVIFVEEPVWVDGGEPRVETGERPGGVRVVKPLVPHGTPEAVVIDHQRAVLDGLVADARGAPLVLWFYTPMALAFSRHVPADLIVFDKMDELSAFQNAPPLLLALEQELLELSDVVFTGGASMHEAAAHRHANIHCFPSSIDTAHFAQARAGLPDPADQAQVAHPRLGFFGVIDERFDIALLGEVAAQRPDWQFVMIGPVVKIDPAHLPQGANIHWLGGKGYAELPTYLANWDIGWMPFAINEATRYISPTKTPEFLAAGLPVVSTAIRDVIAPYGEAGLVEIAVTADETVAAVEMLLARPRAEWLARVDAQLAQGSWDRTWAAMHARMTEILDAEPSATIIMESENV